MLTSHTRRHSRYSHPVYKANVQATIEAFGQKYLPGVKREEVILGASDRLFGGTVVDENYLASLRRILFVQSAPAVRHPTVPDPPNRPFAALPVQRHRGTEPKRHGDRTGNVVQPPDELTISLWKRSYDPQAENFWKYVPFAEVVGGSLELPRHVEEARCVVHDVATLSTTWGPCSSEGAPTCSVCLADYDGDPNSSFEYEEGTKICTLKKCGHAFHENCLQRWLEKGKATCRNEFFLRVFFYEYSSVEDCGPRGSWSTIIHTTAWSTTAANQCP